MEAEFVLRGLAVLVERCQPGGESVRVWHFVDHLSEFAQEEVRVRYGLVRSPGYRLRREVRQERVDCGHRLEFPMHHVLATLFGYELNKK